MGLLTNLRSIFKGEASSSAIHITIRGPYEELPDAKQVSHFWDIIRTEGILLNGVSHFDFQDRRIVYLRASGKGIRKMWWKPDFPIQQYGFNPHITLYEGTESRAVAVERFLRRERLEFVCTDLSLRFHDTAQRDLLSQGDPQLLETIAPGSALIRSYRWKPGIEQRAVSLVKGWQVSSRDDPNSRDATDGG